MLQKTQQERKEIIMTSGDGTGLICGASTKNIGLKFSKIIHFSSFFILIFYLK